MPIYQNIREGTPRWHAMRAKGIGGSEVAALFGEEKRTYGLSLWGLYQTKGGFMELPEQEVPTRAIAGQFFEDSIIRIAAKQEGWDLRRGGYAVCDADPRARHSLDRQAVQLPERLRIDKPQEFWGPGVIEAKMVSKDQQFEEYGWNPEEPKRLTPPKRHKLQLQHGLLCTGFAWGALVCGFEWDNVQVYYYPRDQDLHEDILTRIAALYDRIDRRDPPPVDGNETTDKIIKNAFRRPSFQHLDLPDSECEEADEELLALLSWREVRKDAEQQERLHGNKVRNRIGAHETMQTNTHLASWKLNKNGDRGPLRIVERERK